jgi:ribosomal protein S18 acetylase RimI-like enzyme
MLPQTLTLSDLPRATEVMSSAFRDDPLWVYLFPEVEQRQRILPKFFRVVLTLGISSGQAYGVGSPLEGVAVWGAPDSKSTFNLPLLLQNGLPQLVLSRFPFRAIKAAKIFGQFERMHREYAPMPQYYLTTIGVRPEAQGKGIASKLIKPFLAKSKDEGCTVYTETITPQNVSLYQHYGFKVMEQYSVPRTDLNLWSFLIAR